MWASRPTGPPDVTSLFIVSPLCTYTASSTTRLRLFGSLVRGKQTRTKTFHFENITVLNRAQTASAKWSRTTRTQKEDYRPMEAYSS